jgi:hypothetical protein
MRLTATMSLRREGSLLGQPSTSAMSTAATVVSATTRPVSAHALLAITAKHAAAQMHSHSAHIALIINSNRLPARQAGAGRAWSMRARQEAGRAALATRLLSCCCPDRPHGTAAPATSYELRGGIWDTGYTNTPAARGRLAVQGHGGGASRRPPPRCLHVHTEPRRVVSGAPRT